MLSSEASLPASADVVRLEHLPDAYDQGAQAPSVAAVAVQGRDFHFVNNGWNAAAMVLAFGGVGLPQRELLLEVRVDLGQLDETANVVKVLLEDQPAAHMTGCYSGEPIEVRLYWWTRQNPAWLRILSQCSNTQTCVCQQMRGFGNT